jgi:hypothetical protein
MLKSTEIVLEQLIIGLLTLVIVYLFVWGYSLAPLVSEVGKNHPFFYGVLIIIVAYAVGIVVDRWSDTLLGQLEGRIRDNVYSETKNGRIGREEESFTRIKIRKKGDRVADYHDYLRRRMRITRSLTCLMPALFLALAFLDDECLKKEFIRHSVGGCVFLYYSILLIICISRPRNNEAPKVKDRPAPRSPNGKKPFKSRSGECCDPGLIGLILFGFLGTCFLIDRPFCADPVNSRRVLLFLGGILLTFMIGWTWGRICKTFFTYIKNYMLLEQEENSAKS